MMMQSLRAWSARLGLLGLIAAASATPANAQIDTYVVAPVETAYTTTSYLVPTLYETTYTAAPTSYLLPTTSYLTTSYVAPRRSLLRSLFRPTSATYYVPTAYSYSLATPTSYVVPTAAYLSTSSYVVPTVYDSGVVPTSFSPCDEAPTTFRAPAPTSPTSSQRSSSMKSSPKGAARPNPAAARQREEPVTVGPDGDDRSAPLTDPAGSPPLPDMPAGMDGIPPGPNQSLRPVPSNWGVLIGVVKDQKGRAQEGVKLVVRSRSTNAAFGERSGVTNAFGQFAIGLPEGDWEVRMPKDNGEFVSKDITVSGGEITTNGGKTTLSSLTFIR